MTARAGVAERDADPTGAQQFEELDELFRENLRLGHDLRFQLVCVGGGAARIGEAIIARKPRYIETVAINCDARVQELDGFDRRVYLGAGTEHFGETTGSPTVGGHLAREAEPVLDRIFADVDFVTIVASLGGGTGTGVLPFVLEAAARRAGVLSVFLVKPFRCEGDRRGLAERAIGRLHFVDTWVEKLGQHTAQLQVLDNEDLVPDAARLPLRAVNRHWADIIADHIQREYVNPAEAFVHAGNLSARVELEPVPRGLSTPEPLAGAPIAPPAIPSLSADPGFVDAELTFEVELPPGRSLDL